MKQTSISALRTIAGVAVVLAVGPTASGMGGSIFEQIGVLSPKQWVCLMAGRLAPNLICQFKTQAQANSRAPSMAATVEAGKGSAA